MTTCDIVVARHKEDISWMGYLTRNENNRVILFNDGSQLTDYILYKNFIIGPTDKLPSEAGKYLKYIIDQYDELPDRIVFCQASPFDHSPDFVGLLSVMDKWAPVQNLTYRGHPPPWGPHKELFNETYMKKYFIDNYRVWMEDHMTDDLQGINYNDYYIHALHEKELIRHDIVPYLLNLFGVKEGPIRPKAFGACFSVTRDIIHKYPKDFYVKILDWYLEPRHNDIFKEEYCSVKNNAILLEYLWIPIFLGVKRDS